MNFTRRPSAAPAVPSAAVLAAVLAVLAAELLVGAAAAQTVPPQPPPAIAPAPSQPGPSNQFSSNELVDAGHRFFGGVSRGLAMIVEKAVSRWGQPNGYILGEEASGAFVGGLRYGDGTLYTKNAGDLRVFWQGPSIGFDAGADGAQTMMLVYNLPRTDAIFERFGGINGSAYFIGGFGMTALVANNITVVPITPGVGLRLGANLGYLKFTDRPTCGSVLTPRFHEPGAAAFEKVARRTNARLGLKSAPGGAIRARMAWFMAICEAHVCRSRWGSRRSVAVESVMYFGIGFLVAALLGLLFVPLVHNRAVRLTMKRLEASTPLSIAEIRADKDQLRAEFAMTTRRLEMSVDKLKAKTTTQLAELGKRADAINHLKKELSEKTATIFALETRDKTLRDRLRATEEEFQIKSSALREAERQLADKEAELKAKLLGDLGERSLLADLQRTQISPHYMHRPEALKVGVADYERAVAETEHRLTRERADAEAAGKEIGRSARRARRPRHSRETNWSGNYSCSKRKRRFSIDASRNSKRGSASKDACWLDATTRSIACAASPTQRAKPKS